MTERVGANRFHADLPDRPVLCDGANAFFRTDTIEDAPDFWTFADPAGNQVDIS